MVVYRTTLWQRFLFGRTVYYHTFFNMWLLLRWC